MSATPPPTLQKLKSYPKMTNWFDPRLLIKLLWQVILSQWFGQFADRRLMVAALDTVADEDLAKRARQFMPGQGEAAWSSEPDNQGAIWVDFVADLGDGFDPTYAIASLLSQEVLDINGYKTKRGQLLVMGGDEVYPNASVESYLRKLRDPYDWAFPDPTPNLVKGPPVYAIPGNHDWYDGLVIFLALFSRKQHLRLGGWRTHQRRSYFALQLTENWWIWAIDAQLDDNIDQPQRDYFAAMAATMPDNTNLILCGPEPGWLYTLKFGNKALHSIDYLACVAMRHCKGLKIPLVMSGDTHHYSRYVDKGGTTNFITSGGGGAFLHPTHHLKPMVNLDRESDGIGWMEGRVKEIEIAQSKDGKEALYPTRPESRRLLIGNLAFAFTNFGFAMLLGFFYTLFSVAAVTWPYHSQFIIPLTLFAGFFSYTRHQEGGGPLILSASIVNAAVHSAAFWLMFSAVRFAPEVFPLDWPTAHSLIFALKMIFAGGLVAGTLFGVYLLLSSLLLGINNNDAFSSMRLASYKNFVRLRIHSDQVTVFPIGLDHPPKRSDWIVNERREGTPPPAFTAKQRLQPRLIEEPIEIRAR